MNKVSLSESSPHKRVKVAKEKTVKKRDSAEAGLDSVQTLHAQSLLDRYIDIS
jgi:flagellin-specific chaperone FliS